MKTPPKSPSTAASSSNFSWLSNGLLEKSTYKIWKRYTNSKLIIAKMSLMERKRAEEGLRALLLPSRWCRRDLRDELKDRVRDRESFGLIEAPICRFEFRMKMRGPKNLYGFDRSSQRRNSSASDGLMQSEAKQGKKESRFSSVKSRHQRRPRPATLHLPFPPLFLMPKARAAVCDFMKETEIYCTSFNTCVNHGKQRRPRHRHPPHPPPRGACA